MTSKASTRRLGAGQAALSVSTSSAQSSSTVQQVSLDSHILASRIVLPPKFSIVFAQFIPLQSSLGHQDIDLARRQIFESSSRCALENSLLPYSQISRNVSTLWVFAIEPATVGKGGDSLFASRLQALNLQGLTRTGLDRFGYRDIYPCCISCSMQRNPCPTCLQPVPPTSSSSSSPSCQFQTLSDDTKSTSREPTPTLSPSLNHFPASAQLASVCHLPRKSLRQPYAFFLSAVQERIISDICEHAMQTGKVVRRLRSGVLWGLSNPLSTWGDGWEQHGKLRPLSFCQIEVTLFPSGILVQPRFRSTHFLPFLPSLPLPSGTPINLLPFSTPAYYLNMYTGPTSALVKQFQASLVGLGAGNFLSPKGRSRNTTDPEALAQFVIAWVGVQNKQGEEKGLMVIWPARLCLSLMSTPGSDDDSGSGVLFAYNRKPLSFIPELPIALQASPVPAPATVPIQRDSSPQDSLVSSGLFTPIGPRPASREASPSANFPVNPSNHPKLDRLPLSKASSSFSAEATQAFRSLAISQCPSRDIRRVAVGVGKYVDFIAKERERERERIRKEREAAASGQGAKGTAVSRTPGAGSSSVNAGISVSLQPRGLAVTMPSSQILPSITVNTHPLIIPSQVQTPHPPVSLGQPSYPSPPDEAVPVDQTMSLSKDGGRFEGFTTQIAMNGIQQSSVAPSESYDSLGSMDSFMMDLGIDFDMNISSSTAHQSGISSETAKVDFDSLGVFTDDDFSFFDDPVRTTSTTYATEASHVDQFTLQQASSFNGDEAIKSLGISQLFGDNFLTPIPDTIPDMSPSLPSPWSAVKFTDGFELKLNGMLAQEGLSAPELVPSSPDRSSSSPPGPATPIFVSESETPGTDFTQPFYPIHFPSRFRSSDIKYAIGKFSSPFIDRDVEREHPVTMYWTADYPSLTDPRIGVVKRLIGVKRKIDVQGVRFPPLSPPFNENQAEWNGFFEDDVSVVGGKTEQDSDEEYQCIDDEDDLTVSRPLTPLPPHIPLGPTLLSTQFSHSLLLPTSVSLRPTGAPFAVSDMASPIPNPVPTPVSPAAALGLANEKSKSLEATVQSLGREVVENVVWADAWRASSVDQTPTWRQDDQSELVDDFSDSNNLPSIGWPWDTMSIDDFSRFASLQSSISDVKNENDRLNLASLEQPMFAVGKAGGVIHLSPPALRFWVKMGLSPRSGPKDVAAFVIYQDDERISNQAEEWLGRISAIYTAKGYGSHTPGSTRLSVRTGLIPVQFTSFRKNLISVLDSIESTALTLLFYVVTPSSILSLSSPMLRQIFSALKRALVGHEEKPVHFHFVPDSLLSPDDDISTSSSLEMVVDGVYDRLQRSGERFKSRLFFAYRERTKKLFEAPSFTLARTSVATSLSFHHPSLDLGSLEHHTLLHVGYKLTKCGKWVVAACIDQRGEGHDLGVWLAQDEIDHKQTVLQVWNFAMDFARRADVEWRIAFAKLGVVNEAELEAWNALLSDELASDSQDIAMHVSIISLEGDSGWSVLKQETSPRLKPSPDFHAKNQLFSKAFTTYSLPTLLQCPLSSSYNADIGAQFMYIPDDDEAAPSGTDRLRPLITSVLITVPSGPGHTLPRAHYIHLLQTAKFPSSTLTKTDEETHRDICRNYHELAVLTCARWHMHVDPVYPYHLAALQVLDTTLELSSATLD